jgi:DNA-binding SARP family transcriptional activator/tetratricopeptide (TPR) repeat protein
LDFKILGALEAWDGDIPLALGGVRERSLLAVLLLNANELLPMDRLVDELWGEEPPKAAVKTVQVYVSRLRKLLGAQAIVTCPPGYRLQAHVDQIDLHRFERLAGEGRRALAAGDAATAGERLREALSLWRGAPLADFVYEPFAQPHVARLEELRLAAVEDRIDADLRCGLSTELVGELQAVAARHPLRERLRGQLMLALYRSARQAEALDVYRDTRTTLVEELGIEPSRELHELELAMLTQDPSLERPGARPAPRAAGIFVGRDEELTALLAALEQAQAGHGSVCLISGEPGIGKSRLADELTAHARDRDFGVLRGRCWEAGGAPGYWPWVQVLAAYVRGVEPDMLRRRLGPGAPELAELLPELHEVLGELPSPAVRDPQARRFRLFDAAAALLRAVAAEERPLLVVLDDLHAADEPSLLLLQFLAGTVVDTRIVVVGAYRDTEIGPAHPGHPLDRLIGDLVSERAVARIALEGLRRDDVGTYVELSEGRRPTEPTIDSIHRSTAGNPLFVVETVRLLSIEGRLDRAESGTTVPAGVREAIDRRLERLPEATREALNIASVLGREFDPQVLERLRPEDDVAGALDEAIAARLVTAAPGTPGLLGFSHELVRDALYDALAPRRRRELHGGIATELERSHAADPGPHLAKLAQHFFEAVSTDHAVEYANLGAERAASQLAYEEAARLYRLGIQALERGGAADETRLCDLLLGLGDVQARAGEEAGAQETFRRAAEVARRAGMVERLGRAALGYGGRWVWTVMRGDAHVIPLLEEAIAGLPEKDSALRARLLARLAAGPLKAKGDATRGRRFALSADAVEMARRLGDPDVLAWALDGRKVAIWSPESLEEHWAVIEELRELAEQGGDPEQLVDAHICTLIKLFEQFELSRFEAEYARAAKAARQLRQPGQRWLVAVMAPIHALLVGRLADAERLIEEAVELGREAAPWNAQMASLLQRFVLRGLEGRLPEVEHDLRSAAVENPEYPILQAALASLYSDLGDTADARAAFDGLAGDNFAALPFDEEWLLAMAFLADACAFLDDTERAALLYERLERYGHRMVVGPIEVALGSGARPLGKLAATLGRPEQAAHWFEHAALENERVGATPWAAHARLDHARLLVAQGDQEAAEPLLEKAAASYRSLGMDTWTSRCGSLVIQAPAAAQL